MTTFSDSADRYGMITRALHWGMALLFGWMVLTVALRMAGVDAPLAKAIWSTHQQAGFLVLVLASARASWALSQARRRPGHDGRLGVLARLGHMALYAGMVAVPLIAVLRSYGSGRGLEVFGLKVIPGAGEKIEVLTQLGGALHGELGLALFALIAGHIAMAVLHAHLFRDKTFSRMAG